jgi:hypothetical protein
MGKMIDQYFQPEKFKHFHEEGTNFYKTLKPYSDVNAPAFFYSTRSIEQIMLNHKGPAVMIVNNDIRPIQKNLEWVKNRKNLYFISTSKLMSVYLDGLGLRYVEFPWHVGDLRTVTSHPKGNSVYFYGAGKLDNLYGYHIFTRIMKEHFPHLNVIYARYKPSSHPPFVNYSKGELSEVYKKVFVSVRMTRFDGLSDTVQSLGVRGIKTIWNGGTPSALSYGSVQDIINHIRNEEKTIGFNDIELSNKCKAYLDPANPDYKYIFDIKTYEEYKDTPKLFINDKPLTFQDFNNVLGDRHNMNQPFII